MSESTTNTLVIDRSSPRWFAWIKRDDDRGSTIGFVSSLQEALRESREAGFPCDFWIFLDENVLTRV